jgi:shikimate dehydrogenase
MIVPPVRYALGLIGYPLEHSLSPALHHAALQAAGLEGEYRCYPVPPISAAAPAGEAQLRKLLERVRRGELHGLNVTIPHKESILPWLDDLSPAASGIGAVNTILRRGDRLVGDNTDAAGFLADLHRLGWLGPDGLPVEGSAPAHALVIGAGGAARAVAYALAQAGWTVVIVARRPEQAARLAADLEEALVGGKISQPRLYPRQRVHPLLPGAPARFSGLSPSLVVNATPVGMSPDRSASPWPDGLPFPEGGSVYDLVYQPEETPLVSRARAAGLRAANGLGMLVEQAALSFTAWTGQVAPVEAMRRAVELK